MIDGSEYYHSFQIQEFRRPEFEVTARNETAGPYFAGDQAVVAVRGQILRRRPAAQRGGDLAGSYLARPVTPRPTGRISPLGPGSPGGGVRRLSKRGFGRHGRRRKSKPLPGRRMPAATHYLQPGFRREAASPRPVSVLGRGHRDGCQPPGLEQHHHAAGPPGQTCTLACAATSYFVDRGTPLKVDFIVTDLDGKPVADRPVEVRAARLEWKYQNGNWNGRGSRCPDLQPGLRPEPVTCTFETPLGGTYQITADVTR